MYIYLFGTRPAYIVLLLRKYHAIRQHLTLLTLRRIFFDLIYSCENNARIVSMIILSYWKSFKKYIAQKLCHITIILQTQCYSIHCIKQLSITIDLDRLSTWKFYSLKRLSIAVTLRDNYNQVFCFSKNFRIVSSQECHIVSNSMLNSAVFLKMLLPRVASDKYNFHDLKIRNFLFFSFLHQIIFIRNIIWRVIVDRV